MASNSENLYVTFVDTDRDLLKVWGQRSRIGATYIERQLLQLMPQFNRTPSPNPSRIHKGMLCFAKYTDDNYYRARVISNVEEDSVWVLFVDYGNKVIIKISEIRIQEGSEGDVLSKMAEQAEEFYLARVAAPSFGWSKEIISQIRRDIYYEECNCNTIAQVGDQKILEIQFHNEDFSDHLLRKEMARSISLSFQRQMILSYCSLVSNDPQQTSPFREVQNQRDNFNASASAGFLPNAKASFRLPKMRKELHHQLNFDKPNNPANFTQPPPSQYHSTKLFNSNKNSSSSPHNISMNQPATNENFSPTVNPGFNPMFNNQCNPLYQMKGTPLPLLNTFNNVMIEALAKQIKQYIVEDNVKSDAENIPHHYVNSVLEVGNTYNVFVSCIDDGPWSFSVHLLSSESELEKLMSELSSCDLVNIKPPIILGHPCVALNEYGNYLRGVVVSVSHSAVKVYFVDYGNSEDLPASSIYELPPKFFKTRVLSQKFSLSGLQKVAYSDDIKRFFNEVVQDKLLLLRVITLEDDNLPTCELFHKDKNIKYILNEKIRNLRSLTQEEFPKVGETENVTVTWVVSPQKFFVQLRKKDLELNALKNELAGVTSIGQRMTFQQLRVGLKCVSHYTVDGLWYRAVITSLESESAIKVFYIDYGNTETVDILSLLRVDGNNLINQMNAQAIPCSLKDFENEPFDQEMTDRLEALILERDLKLTVISSDKEHISVKLFDNGNDISVLLSESSQPSANVMSFENVKSDWDPSPDFENKDTNSSNRLEKRAKFPKQADPFEKRGEKNFRGDKFSYENRENWREDSRKVDEASSKFSGYREIKKDREINWDDEKMPSGQKPFRSPESNQGRDKTNWREENFEDRKKFEKNRSPKAGFDSDKGFGFGLEEKRFEKRNQENVDFSKKKFLGDPSEKFGKFSGFKGKEMDEAKTFRKPVKKEDIASPGSKFEERILEKGSTENGIVTYYFNPHDFFVQVITQENEFKQMMQDIQSYYNDKYSLRDPVETGDIVIAQFSLDKILYRAEVIKPSPVTVRYVDYGNQEPVAPKSTWPVDKKFLSLPKQVFRCQLSNIQPIGSDWPPPGSEIDKFFEAEEYKCTFLNFADDIYEIVMENVANGKDVASQIIEAGLAKKVIADLDVADFDYTLLPNQILRLCISNVDCSSKFHVLLNPTSAKIIEEEIKSYTKNKENLKPLPKSSLLPETVCLTTDDDVSWYRGTIIEVSENKAIVLLEDNGRKVEVNIDKLKELPEHLKNIQTQAVECSLYGISDSSLNEEDFKNSVENKTYLISIKSAVNKRLSVVLYDDKGQILDFQKFTDAPEKIEPIQELPIISQKFPLIVAHLNSPKEVYIQSNNSWEALESLSEQLFNFYSEKTGYDVKEEEKDLYVAAKSNIFDSWYRGKVVNWGNDELEIFYIDYGNIETLPLENLKVLDASFFSLSAFAKKVVLDIEYNNDLTQELNDKILELTQNKETEGYFVNSGTDFLSEFIINGEKMRPMLESSGLILSEESDKFSEFFFKEKPTVSPNNFEKEILDQKPDEFESGNLKVFVSHIDNPKQFWVHNENAVNDLHILQDKLQKMIKQLSDKQNVNLNDIVAAMFSDMWYRAEVIHVEENIIKVRFIDYGNVLDINLNSSSVKELPAELISVPSFATRYALCGTWDEEATLKFEAIILESDDPVNLIILEEGEPPVVDLFQNGQSIREKLAKNGVESEVEGEEDDLSTVYITHSNTPDDFYIQRKHSTYLLNDLSERLLDFESLEDVSFVQENEIYAAKFPEDQIWYRAKVLKKHSDETDVIFIDYGNSSKVTELKNLPLSLLGISELAENCSLVYGTNCDEWSSAACEKFAEYADGRPLKMKVVINRSKKPIVRLFHEESDISEELGSLCENDNRGEVFISHALSPTDFYIQYVDDEKYATISECLEKGNDWEDFEDPKPGQLCSALFEEDGLWYRARITQNLDEGCEVFFIDFGNVSVSTELKKLPQEIEDIPPRALKCSLDLSEKNIPESIKEEFINLTTNEAPLFRARIITPGEINIISLKLEGRIIEKTLGFGSAPEESNTISPFGFTMSKTLDDETDDDKKSKINASTESYLSSNLEDAVIAGSSVRNETDEEKRVKFAIADGSSEGFKSDDEKGIAEGTVLSSIVNATDNELIEEIQEYNEESVDEGNNSELVIEAEENQLDVDDSRGLEDENNSGFPLNVVNITENKTENDCLEGESTTNAGHGETSQKTPEAFLVEEEKLPESISCKKQKKGVNENLQIVYHKIKHSDKLVPGSISMGITLESDIQEEESLDEVPQRQTTQSAPNSPNSSKNEECDDSISEDVPISCKSNEGKVSPVDKTEPDSGENTTTQN